MYWMVFWVKGVLPSGQFLWFPIAQLVSILLISNCTACCTIYCSCNFQDISWLYSTFNSTQQQLQFSAPNYQQGRIVTQSIVNVELSLKSSPPILCLNSYSWLLTSYQQSRIVFTSHPLSPLLCARLRPAGGHHSCSWGSRSRHLWMKWSTQMEFCKSVSKNRFLLFCEVCLLCFLFNCFLCLLFAR